MARCDHAVPLSHCLKIWDRPLGHEVTLETSGDSVPMSQCPIVPLSFSNCDAAIEMMKARIVAPMSQCPINKKFGTYQWDMAFPQGVGAFLSQCPIVPMTSLVCVCMCVCVCDAHARTHAYSPLSIGTLGHWDIKSARKDSEQSELIEVKEGWE